MTPEIEVWVCARPGASQLGPVLAALTAAGAEPRVVTAPPGQGPAAARNEALSRCEAEVLAFVDDDVEVGIGWLDALRAAWAGPEADELGCAGGPLVARFTGEQPRWLADPLVHALGVDAFPTPSEGGSVLVDPAVRTFYGGNVSFRAAALRAVGGFWPAHGAPGLRDRLGEEHRAQHELAAAGWQAALVGGAHAVRRIDSDALRARDVVLLRARYGARSGAVGTTRKTAVAARAAMKAAVGVPVAAVHGDTARVVERAARAAENAGVLAAPLLAQRSLHPATARTPFLHSVAPPPPSPLRSFVRRGAGGMRGGGPLVLLYHRVAATREDPMALQVSPQHLAEQFEVLCTRRTPVRLEQILVGEAPDHAVAVTFDDGYADVFEAALPALEAAGIPATVFISTGHVRSGKVFWWDAVARLLRSAPEDAGSLELVVEGELRVWPARDAGQRELAFRCLIEWLHAQSPEAIDAVLHAMAWWAHVDDPLVPSVETRPMTVDELRRLAASRMITIGSHGVDHACLSAVAPQRRDAELVGAREDLNGWLGTKPAGVAYPYGVPGVDVDAATRDAARAAGYAYGVVNAPGAMSRDSDVMALPRAAVGDAGADAFDAWLRTV